MQLNILSNLSIQLPIVNDMSPGGYEMKNVFPTPVLNTQLSLNQFIYCVITTNGLSLRSILSVKGLGWREFTFDEEFITVVAW